MPRTTGADRSWIDFLDEADLAFLKRFVLASGTLKDVAREYGISYPTVRLRLDRLIAKVEALELAWAAGPFERTLRAAYAEGRLDEPTFRALLNAYHEEERRDG